MQVSDVANYIFVLGNEFLVNYVTFQVIITFSKSGKSLTSINVIWPKQKYVITVGLQEWAN